MKGLILVGGGGHCRSCIDVIETQKEYSIIGIIDAKDRIGEKVLGYPVIGSDEDIPKLSRRTRNFLITVGQIGNADKRRKLEKMLKKAGAKFPVIVSPVSYVSKRAKVGEGTIVMHGCVINAGAVIGEQCIINTKVSIDHDCRIEGFAHIAPGVSISGGVRVGNGAMIGTGSSIIQGIKIGRNTLIGAGSAVVNDIGAGVVAYGNPCRKRKNK